jgi:hypothetical protein
MGRGSGGVGGGHRMLEIHRGVAPSEGRLLRLEGNVGRGGTQQGVGQRRLRRIVAEEGRALRGRGRLGRDLSQEDSLGELDVLLGGLHGVGVGVHEVFEGLQPLIASPLLTIQALDALDEGHALLAREHIGALDTVRVSSEPRVDDPVGQVGDVEVLEEPLGDGLHALERLEVRTRSMALVRRLQLLLQGQQGEGLEVLVELMEVSVELRTVIAGVAEAQRIA